jgi:glucokinase
LPYIQSETFFNAFVRKGRFEPLLRNMSLKVSLNSQTALLGAAHFAKDKKMGEKQVRIFHSP